MIGTSNVVLDVATAVLPVNLLFDLQVPWKSKIIIMSAFGARIM